MAAPVPTHPEAVPGEPATLRWVVPAGTLDFVGAPRVLPPVLAALVDDGTLTDVLVQPDAVRLRLGADRTWRSQGGRVREALQEALATPQAWTAPDDSTPDDVLRMAVEDVIAGDVGDYVRGHGGRISLVGVRDGRVEVSMGGACAHCPASDLTLTERVEDAVRARCGDLRELVARDEPGVAGGRRLLGLLPTRR